MRDTKRRLALKVLGFQEDPFTRSANPRFLYLSPQHKQVADGLMELVDSHRGLAVVEGGYGMGKSSLARHLEASLLSEPESYLTLYVHTASYKNEFAALVDICDAFKLPRRRGATQQWRELEHFLIDQAEAGYNIILILDDAHTMEPDALLFVHHLYNFDVRRKLAQVILFAQPEISRLFQRHPETASRVDSWFRLNALSLEETYELVRFRCTVAGREEPFLTQSATIRLWEETQGNPREIVSLCSIVVDVLGELNKSVADEQILAASVERWHETIPPVLRTTAEQPLAPAGQE